MMTARLDPSVTGPDSPDVHGTAGPPQKLRIGFVVTFFLANLGLWIAYMTPIIVTLPLKINAVDPNPKTQALTLSLVLLCGSVVGIIANPICGRISDRTTWRIGRRRPWLIIGVVLAAVGMTVLGTSETTAPVVFGWMINQIGVNMAMAVLVALLPDQVPEHRRGLVSGLLGVGQAAASMLGTGIAFALSRQSLTLALVVPTIVALVLVVAACFVIKDRRLTKAERPAFDLKAFVGSFWTNPRKHPDFGWAWWSRFALFMSVSMVLNYQLFYLMRQVGLPEDEATAMIPIGIGVQTACIVVVSIVFGALSDKMGRRKLFVGGSAIILAIGLLVGAFASSVAGFLILMALVGLGQGTYLAVDLALVTDILPDREKDAAKDMGVFNLANLIPQSIAPAIAPLFLVVPFFSVSGQEGQNYTMLFLGGAVMAMFAAILLKPVKKVR
jgi:MFS family permease